MSRKAKLAEKAGPAEGLDPEAAWKQVLARDPKAEFFYGVTTTGVFCRPGCRSKRPLRANVRFFRRVDDARAAGFRACQRCSPTDDGSFDKNRAALDKIRTHLELHLDRAVPLAELARLVKLSPFTVQRLFKREMSVSPLQYQRALRARSLRGALKRGDTVTNAIYEAGFGSSSRAYEGTQLGMTPARFAQGGHGEQIGFTTARTPFGWIVVGATKRGLCWLALCASSAEAEASLREEFPAAAVRRDPSLSSFVDAALAMVGGSQKQGSQKQGPQKQGAKDGSAPKEDAQSPSLQNQTEPAALDLRGTAFQLRVWQALRQIPRGETRTYSQLARELGDPNSTRAVARACALNRVSLMVPCHRVVGMSGSLTGYRWGVDRKRQLLAAERG
jgi:AraC family transcriptional regulator, regulatory protein of adaptative response / methylated-DNA-[protein]-cysteine methyltransferase